LVFPGVGGLPRGQTNPDRNNWAPRAGFSYQLTPKTVIRGGAGIFYAVMHIQSELQGISGYSSQNTVVSSLDGITPATFLDNPYPQGLIYPTGSSLGLATLLGQNVQFIQRNAVNPYALQWNFNIQRELPGTVLFDIAYVANRGVKLESARTYNQLPDSALALGDSLRTLVPNPFAGQIMQGALASPTVSRAQLLRPFPHFTNVSAAALGFGNSIYHSLQVKVERRFARGMTFLTSYTYSKLIDDVGGQFAGETVGGTGVQNWNNLRAERGVSRFDQAQSLVFSYVWELPFGRGRTIFGGTPGVLAKVIEGWQVQGVLSFQSGSPLGVSANNNATFSQGGGQRPNWTGTSASLGGNSTPDQWFDGTQFNQPPPYTFGNAPPTMGDLRADGARNLDFTLAKNTRIREGHTIQLRAETFNLTNTTRFGIPGQTFGAPTFARVSTQLNSPRVIQLALKYVF
jgi:hypothetical protein